MDLRCEALVRPEGPSGSVRTANDRPGVNSPGNLQGLYNAELQKATQGGGALGPALMQDLIVQRTIKGTSRQFSNISIIHYRRPSMFTYFLSCILGFLAVSALLGFLMSCLGMGSRSRGDAWRRHYPKGIPGTSSHRSRDGEL